MKILPVLFSGIFIFNAAAVAQHATHFQYNNGSSLVIIKPVPVDLSVSETPHGLRMRNTGRTLTICGSVLAIGGIIMMNNADALYYSANTSSQGTVEEGDAKGALGVLMTVGGVGMVIPGVILWSKGQKKYNRYKEQQSVSFHTAGTTVSFRYSF